MLVDGGDLAVFHVALIREFRDVRQACLQFVDELHRGGWQVHLLAVVSQAGLAVLPRQQLLAIIGVGIRTAHGNVA